MLSCDKDTSIKTRRRGAPCGCPITNGFSDNRFSDDGFSDAVGALLVGARSGSGLVPLCVQKIFKDSDLFQRGSGGLIILNTIKGLLD